MGDYPPQGSGGGGTTNPITTVGVTTEHTGNTDASYKDVAGLSVQLEADKIYTFELIVFYIAHTTPDIKFNLVIPSIIEGEYGAVYAQSQNSVAMAEPTEVLSNGGGTTTQRSSRWYGYFITDAAGEFKIQEGQQTAFGTANTVLRGTKLIVEDLGAVP